MTKKNVGIIIVCGVVLAVGGLLYRNQALSPKTAPATGVEENQRILVIAPLTGPGAALGVSSRAGMQMALEDLPKDGRQLELVYQDSRTDPNVAVTILAGHSLHSNSKVFIGEMSQVTRALVAPAERARLLMFATLVGVPNIGGGSPSFVRVNVMSDAIAPPLARFAAKHESTMAILYLNDDYGRVNSDLFSKTYTNFERTVVMTESFDRDPSVARLLVEKVRQSGASGCFIAGYGPVYPELFKVFKQLAPAIHIYADIGLANAPVFKAVGPAAEGVVLAATEADEFPPTTPRARMLAERFSRAVPGVRTDYVVAYSYDTVQVLAEALKAVPDGDPVRVKEYLVSRSFEGYGGKFKIDPASGDSIYEPLPLFRVTNGSIIRITEDK